MERFNRWAKSYDRHWMQRLTFEPVHRTLLDLAAAEVPQPAAILDVGCGTGRLLRSAAARFPRAELAGVDPAPEMVRHARESAGEESAIRFQQSAAEELPFPNDRFDLVFSTLTFHHWSDQPKAVGEVARVLAPGGRWLLADFVASGLLHYVRRLLRMKRFPERESLAAMLRPIGLALVGERKVPGLLGQVAVLAIGAAD